MTDIDKAWEYQSNRRWHEKEANPKAFDDPYIQGMTDFKASLKKAIEKDLDITRGQLSRIAIHHRSKEVRTELKSNIETSECILKLIDTVKPPTP